MSALHIIRLCILTAIFSVNADIQIISPTTDTRKVGDTSFSSRPYPLIGALTVNEVIALVVSLSTGTDIHCWKFVKTKTYLWLPVDCGSFKQIESSTMASAAAKRQAIVPLSDLDLQHKINARLKGKSSPQLHVRKIADEHRMVIIKAVDHEPVEDEKRSVKMRGSISPGELRIDFVGSTELELRHSSSSYKASMDIEAVRSILGTITGAKYTIDDSQIKIALSMEDPEQYFTAAEYVMKGNKDVMDDIKRIDDGSIDEETFAAQTIKVCLGSGLPISSAAEIVLQGDIGKNPVYWIHVATNNIRIFNEMLEIWTTLPDSKEKDSKEKESLKRTIMEFRYTVFESIRNYVQTRRVYAQTRKEEAFEESILDTDIRHTLERDRTETMHTLRKFSETIEDKDLKQQIMLFYARVLLNKAEIKADEGKFTHGDITNAMARTHHDPIHAVIDLYITSAILNQLGLRTKQGTHIIC